MLGRRNAPRWMAMPKPPLDIRRSFIDIHEDDPDSVYSDIVPARSRGERRPNEDEIRLEHQIRIEEEDFRQTKASAERYYIKHIQLDERSQLFWEIYKSYIPRSFHVRSIYIMACQIAELMQHEEERDLTASAHGMGRDFAAKIMEPVHRSSAITANRSSLVGSTRLHQSSHGVALNEYASQHPADGDDDRGSLSLQRRTLFDEDPPTSRPPPRDAQAKTERSRDCPSASRLLQAKRRYEATDTEDTAVAPERRRFGHDPIPGLTRFLANDDTRAGSMFKRPGRDIELDEPTVQSTESTSGATSRKRPRDNDANEPEPTSDNSRPSKKVKTELVSSPAPTRPTWVFRSCARRGASLPPRKRPVHAAQVTTAPATIDVLTSTASTQPSTPVIAAAESDAQARRTRNTRSANMAGLVELDVQGKLAMQR